MGGKLSKIILTGALAIVCMIASAQVKVDVHNTSIPLMVERNRNVVAEICIDNTDSTALLNGVEILLAGELNPPTLRTAELVYTGGMSSLLLRTTSWAMKDQFKRLGGSQIIYANPNYVLSKGAQKIKNSGTMWLDSEQKLVVGKNYFYVSIAVDQNRIKDLAHTLSLEVTQINIDGHKVEFTQDSNAPHRLGIGVRQHGDDGIYAYRIPGLATSNNGTLLGVYDVRYQTSLDLQDDIDVGLSRSTNGGVTWEKMRIIMDMGCWGNLPQAQNGIGDPAILVDEQTGEIFVVAVWTHGIGNDRAWTNIGQGITPTQTAQLMLVSSLDDGRTWSAPRNITPQVKDPSWHLTLQGPGRGITMQDGTLVFALQYVDSLRIPHATIMYSRDHGQTWRNHTPAKSNTTEAQVAEVRPGVLMLNMRDNRKTGRAVFTTNDLGRTWIEHHSSGSLREPVCMASILQVRAKENILGRDILLFSNPDTTKGRNRITIKASLDNGDTWLPENSLLLDEEESWGYSCLTMVDPNTIGILYEGSTGQMVYQSVKLREVVKTTPEAVSWLQLPPTPASNGEQMGLSACFAGVSNNTLIVAGGANFAVTAAADGGKKSFYDNIYIMPNCTAKTAEWSAAGKLPNPIAYGISFPTLKGLIIAGGANSSGALRSVNLLEPKDGTISITPLAELPMAIEQAAGAIHNGVLYLFGGIADGIPSARLFQFDTKDSEPKWEELTPLNEASVQPVMAAIDGALYIWGGFNPSTGTVAECGYRYDITANKYYPIAAIPNRGTATGASIATTINGQIIITGGVDPQIFTEALRLAPENIAAYLSKTPASYNFQKNIYIYNPQSNIWSKVATSGRTARAGSSLASQNNSFFLIGGEVKPGIRTAESWRVNLLGMGM